MSTTTTKRKRKRSRAWFFTWNDVPLDTYRAQIDLCLKDFEYVYQLEKADKVHVQGVMRYKNPRDTWPELPCHWERCRSWKKAIKYCSKTDTRIDGPWTNIRGLTWRESIIDPLAGIELYQWQKDIINIIDSPMERRLIHWYYDNVGNIGKTTLACHIVDKYPKGKILYANGGGKDILYGFSSMLEEHDVKAVIIGLTRSDANYVSYKTLEMLKDGVCYTRKYESHMIRFNPPHVIVLANFPPVLTPCSLDRWRVSDLSC